MLSGRIETETEEGSSMLCGMVHWICRPLRTSTCPRPLAEPMRRPVQQVGGADKAGDERIDRAEIYIVRRADLGDAPLVDHRDAVGERQRLGLVVRDVDGGDADLALQPLELAAHLVAQLRVEIGQRLVEQQQPRLVHDGARERHALLLAAGEPRRGPLLEAVEIDDGERALDRVLDLGCASNGGPSPP